MKSSSLKVLVVGQTPPPYHGQAIMIEMLVRGPVQGVEIVHLRMAYSKSIDEVGKAGLSKIRHLVWLIVQTYLIRFRNHPEILYYPPTGPNKVPLIRDTIYLLFTRWLFKKTVFHFQASGVSELIDRLPAWQRWLVFRALGRPDAAIQLSDLTTNDGGYLDAKAIFTIPNASPDVAASWLDQRPASESDCPLRILYLGTVCETKGILDLIDACSLLKKRGTAFQLHIIGGFQPTEFESTVRSRLQHHGLLSDSTVHGQRTGNDKWSLLSQGDVFCFPTYYESEGFPVVLVEAMSFELAVLSTQWRGIPSIVDDGLTGFLVPPRDTEALAERLYQLACDRQLRKSMGQAARCKFLAHFTDVRHLHSMSEVFHEISEST